MEFDMKQYAVELKRISYITVYVDADSKEQAENEAWHEIETDGSWSSINDANWEVSDIYEQFPIDNK